MSSKRRKRWRLIVAVGLMLAAIVAYIASLDGADPDALPAAVDEAEGR